MNHFFKTDTRFLLDFPRINFGVNPSFYNKLNFYHEEHEEHEDEA